MLDSIQILEERISELIALLRQTASERDELRARVETLEADLVGQQADLEAATESGPLAELEKQRLQALEIVESALSELVQNEGVA